MCPPTVRPSAEGAVERGAKLLCVVDQRCARRRAHIGEGGAGVLPVAKNVRTIGAALGAVLVEPDVVAGAVIRHDAHAHTLAIHFDCGHPQALHYEKSSARHHPIITDGVDHGWSAATRSPEN